MISMLLPIIYKGSHILIWSSKFDTSDFILKHYLYLTQSFVGQSISMSEIY
jgi:hypothetical protein